MAGIGTKLAKDLLDWHLGGAAPSSPTVRAVALASNTPTSVSAYEIANADVVSARLPTTYGAAVLAAGSASNLSAVTFSSFASTRTIIGLTLWDSATSGVGNMLWYGTLSAARTPNPGDSLVFNVGSIVHSIS